MTFSPDAKFYICKTGTKTLVCTAKTPEEARALVHGAGGMLFSLTRREFSRR